MIVFIEGNINSSTTMDFKTKYASQGSKQSFRDVRALLFIKALIEYMERNERESN